MKRKGRAQGQASAPRQSPTDVVLLVLATYYLAAYIAVASLRLVYPFELEWLEGAVLENVHRVIQGEPLYLPPSFSYVPLNYAPLYFWVSGLVAHVLGVDFAALRAVSLASSLVLLGCIYLLVVHETGSRTAGVIGAGLLTATYRAGGAWLDVARVDSLALALLAAGVCALRLDPGKVRSGIVGGVLFCAACMTKQSSAAAVAPLVLWILVSDPRRGLPLAVTLLVTGIGSVVGMQRATGGWFRYYVFDVARRYAMDRSLLWTFPVHDLGRSYGLAGGVVLFVAIRWFRELRSARGMSYVALGLGLAGSSWMLRLYRGGYENVLMTVNVALALAVGMATAALSGTIRMGDVRERLVSQLLQLVLVIQFAMLWWNPAAQVPTVADRVAWEELMRDLGSAGGRVLVSSHPFAAARLQGGSHAHVAPFMDVVKGGNGAIERRLLSEMRDTLSAHVYSVLVLDNRDWLIDEAQSAGYRARRRAFPTPGVGWPVTGMRTRPEWVLTPGPPGP